MPPLLPLCSRFTTSLPYLRTPPPATFFMVSLNVMLHQSSWSTGRDFITCPRGSLYKGLVGLRPSSRELSSSLRLLSSLIEVCVPVGADAL